MLNRALVVAIIIISLAMAGVIGYALATHYRPQSVSTGTPLNADGEQQPPKAPKVFEKDTQGLAPVAWLRESPGHLESSTLKFPLEAFNRVEGEVTIRKVRNGVATPVEKALVFALVLDPHGNVVIRNATYSTHQNEFPWRFSFVASTTGEHGLVVNTGGIEVMDTVYVAHLKVTVYEK